MELRKPDAIFAPIDKYLISLENGERNEEFVGKQINCR